MIIEPGAHIAKPVRQSASIAPTAATKIALGVGRRHAARKIKPSPTCTYPL